MHANFQWFPFGSFKDIIEALHVASLGPVILCSIYLHKGSTPRRTACIYFTCFVDTKLQDLSPLAGHSCDYALLVPFGNLAYMQPVTAIEARSGPLDSEARCDEMWPLGCERPNVSFRGFCQDGRGSSSQVKENLLLALHWLDCLVVIHC